MTPEDVRVLARSAPERWTELDLIHRSDCLDVRATLRHGELPDGVDLALDLGVGIVVRSRHRGGRQTHWFTNEIVRAI